MRRCSHRPGDTRDRQHHRGLGEARKSPPTESLGEQAWPAWPCGLQSLGKGDLCCLKPLVCVHGELHMAKSELRALGEAEDQRMQMLLGGNCARKGLRWGTGEPEAQLLCRACRSFPAGPSHISHPTSHVPHPTSHIPRLTSHIPHPTSHIPHATSHVSCPTSHISHLTSVGWLPCFGGSDLDFHAVVTKSSTVAYSFCPDPMSWLSVTACTRGCPRHGATLDGRCVQEGLDRVSYRQNTS